MSLIDAGLNRSRTVLATLLLLLVAGAFSFIAIPKEAEPDVNIPIIYVSMFHEGISPEDSERLLVRPIEAEMRSIEGVKELRATSYLGGGNVVLEFEAGFNPDTAIDDVREKVDLVRPDLPDDTDEPTVNEVNLSLFPVLVVTLSGNVPERTLMRLARNLQDLVEAVPEVLEATIGGDRDELVEIVVEPQLLESYNVDLGALLELLSRSNQLVAAGTIDTGQGSFAIKVPGLIENLDDILSLPVKVNDNAKITFRDLTSVYRTFRDRDTVARVNGQPAVSLEISKRTGSNIIETIQQVRDIVIAESTEWPDSVTINFSQDKSVQVRTMLSDLQNNVLSAVLLVMIAVVGALGLRSGILVAVAIPGSFLTAILVLNALGMTVNIVVLFSLILAVGMLVDGAIVVTEYADRKIREGEPPDRAYGMAAKRMAWPIITSTATTLAAFAPLLFWPGIVGEFMKFLPITLVATLTASLAMALLFVPVLGANFAIVSRYFILIGAAVLGAIIGTSIGNGIFTTVFSGNTEASALLLAKVLFGGGGALGGWWIGRRLAAIVERNLSRPMGPSGTQPKASDGDDNPVDLAALTGITAAYVRILRGALGRPGIIISIAFATLIGSWVLYGALGKGVEFFPSVEPEQAAVQIHARGNLSVEEKASLVGEVEDRILELQAERGEFDSVYSLSGNPDQQQEDVAEDVIGTISVEFADWDQRRPADVILADIISRSGDLAGILVETRKQESGPPVGKPVQVQLSSRNPDLLEAEVAKVRAFVDTLVGLKDVEDSRPLPGIEWEINVDRAEAAKFGADVAMVGNAVKFVTNGMKITDYRPDDSDDEIDIVARYPYNDRTIDQLDEIRLQTSEGQVPISNFVERVAKPRTGQLSRVDAVRVMTVRADVLPGVLADDMVRQIRAWLPGAGLDPRVEVEFRGEDEEQKAAQAFLQKAFGVALFLMAIILVTQFNSFYSAFLILSAVIMSTVGVMLGLLIVGQPFGIVMSGIGVIALAGIVVNNNIVLIDTFDRLRKQVASPLDAILMTGAQRLRPVLLTTVTTVLGLLPMVLQINIDFVTREISQGAPSTQWWVQLSTAIVAGLTFATVLTLVITPSALMLRENFVARRQARREATPASQTA
ncbi:MAG: efflux RND transporter permease subunit [Rhodospirillaceae bacterium]|jgi:multidrug efflux pump|nr:efflux RND transporter permease subunit [Rhodospirillaceae bacterium]MBT4773807.1 efflux RND transporter permease subunit [Rhodospirillaceae bacterium]MBT5358813.1 efflux RND transporter permease subunit [Rhodospirillaceae bacterium]MBT5768127.1 efflux RND transporter permease subunit [Rhodospirillaceae bacterium]MBT6310680.1 efflux RND transporter permease subunit [Rhodospirillaceae bacterium]